MTRTVLVPGVAWPIKDTRPYADRRQNTVRVCEHIEAHPGQVVPEIAAALGMEHRVTSRAIEILQRASKVRGELVNGIGKNGAPMKRWYRR